MAEQQDGVVALPPVEVDPVFASAVEDAISGPEIPVLELDPQRALGADPHDFAGLYIRHRSSFAMHARRFLRDPRDVDEVVQEAFLRLFLALPELSSELQALAYCRRTVTNLCIDRYRADKRRPRLVNIESLPANDFPEEELDDPVVQAEDAAFVREALSLLTPLHRDALVKREIEEKSIPVIARELDVPEESVKHLLHRARRALRRHLAKTHLAPGANLEEISTLSLLARSAASGGGRAGVALLFVLIVVVGAKPSLPATALSSWPLGELLPAVTRALSPAPRPPVVTLPARGSGSLQANAPAPASQPFIGPVQPGQTSPAPSPTTATLPSASPTASPASTSARPVVEPTVTPSTTALLSPSPSPDPSPGATGTSSPSPSVSASPQPSVKPRSSTPSDGYLARLQESPSPSPSSSP